MTAVVFSDAPLAVGLLTVLEREVLDQVADGLTDQEIGLRLGIGRSRAKDTVARLGMSLGAPGRPAIVAQAYRRRLLPGPDPVPDGRGVLTQEQFALLVLVANGLSNAEIAAALGITQEVAKKHVISLRGVLGAANRAHAVRRAIEVGALTLVPKGGAR